ncbi:thiolase family protein [Patescibacteria group bacterium AH-259-L07]|nr:thiolase family protein [Patescibacteria group bacterium AH-259-L07]
MNKKQRALLENVVIVAGYRTAIGKADKGVFKNTRPDDLAAHVLKGIVEETGIDPYTIDDVRFGCAFPESEQGMEVGRVAVLRAAGLPVEVPGATINRFCSSGLQAIVDEIMYVAVGLKTVAIGGGVESISMVPMGGTRYAPNPYLVKEQEEYYISMGLGAEVLAKQDRNTREEQDEFAFQSHQKALKALEENKFENEILPYPVRNVSLDVSGKRVVEEFKAKIDECPRKDTSLEVLAQLPPYFLKDGTGTVTAGSSSQRSDGAAAVLIMKDAKDLRKHGLKPLARLVSYNVVAVSPEIYGIGPVEAIDKALKSAELSIDDIGIIELNEAFASQVLSVIKRLKSEKGIEMPLEKLNVNGGAIALGHPFGCTGAYLTIKGINEARRRNSQYLMVTMCIGFGMGAAAIFELLY